MTRLVSLVLVLVAVAAFTAPALADPPSPANSAGREILGVVPAHGQASRKTSTGSNLSYHGGPVVHSDKTYAIYWQPAGYQMSSTYTSIINGFFDNVATTNRLNTAQDTYNSDLQYYDGSGGVSFANSAFAGYTVDTNPFPASGCSDSVSATTICLSDSQLRTEIARVATTQAGWTPDGNSIFFMFTPRGVGSCYSSSSCAFSSYCAYHSNLTINGVRSLYANQPYTETVSSACGSGQHPNGDQDADSTINVTSHEHNEAITDPLGNAWYDMRGYENADKCAWNFGTTRMGTPGSYANQTIGTAQYFLQQNWSNKSSGCVLTGQ